MHVGEIKVLPLTQIIHSHLISHILYSSRPDLLCVPYQALKCLSTSFCLNFTRPIPLPSCPQSVPPLSPKLEVISLSLFYDTGYLNVCAYAFMCVCLIFPIRAAFEKRTCNLSGFLFPRAPSSGKKCFEVRKY